LLQAFGACSVKDETDVKWNVMKLAPVLRDLNKVQGYLEFVGMTARVRGEKRQKKLEYGYSYGAGSGGPNENSDFSFILNPNDMSRGSTQAQRDATRIGKAVKLAKLVAGPALAAASSGFPWKSGKSAKGGQFRGQKSNYNATGSTSTEVLAGVSLGTSVRTTKPMTQMSKSGVRVRNRELLTSTINGSATFSVQIALNVNPGLVSMFPWLSIQAGQYEQYKFHALKFVYYPSTNTSTSGDVLMMIDYDAADNTPTTETQFLDHSGATIAPVWEAVSMAASTKEMTALGPKKFVRSVNVAGDIKTYDVAKFFLATNNGASTPIGKLFVEYDVEFFVPQITPGLDLVPSASSTFVAVAAQIISTGTPTVLLCTPYTNTVAGASVAYDALGLAANLVSGVFTPPAGTYRITATGVFNDNTNETFVASVGLFKNSVGVHASTYTYQGISAGTTSGETQTFSLADVVTCGGSDTLSITAYLTGNGTLSLKGNTFVLTFTLA
jgi:hypothetical protein